MKWIWLLFWIFFTSLSSILIDSDEELIQLTVFLETTISNDRERDKIESDCERVELTYMMRRSLNQGPSEKLLSHYRSSLLLEAQNFKSISHSYDADPLWSQWMEELLEVESNSTAVESLEKYYEQAWNPLIFTWYMLNSHITQYIQQNGFYLQSHPLWETLWHRALTGCSSYLHGYIPNTIHLSSRLKLNPYDISPHPGASHSYRSEAVQLVYNHLILLTSFGILPSMYSQVIEYGGGTGLHCAVLRYLGFNGLHLLYDLKPMTLLQQFFLKYSGWMAYLGEKLYSNQQKEQRNNLHGRKIILESNVTHLLSHLNTSSESLSKTLFFASYSLTETPMNYRTEYLNYLFFSRNSLPGYIYIQSDPMFNGVDNVLWLYSLSQNISQTHESCLYKITNQPLLTYLARKREIGKGDGERDAGGGRGGIYCYEINGCQIEDVIFCNMNSVNKEIQ